MIVQEKKTCIRAYCNMDCGNNILEIEYCCKSMKEKIFTVVQKLIEAHNYPPEEVELFTEQHDEECGLICVEFYHDDMHRYGLLFFNALMAELNIQYCDE